MSQPGELLAERWRLVEKIDAGAMGEIFRAKHDLLGHVVAIKVLMPEISRDAAAVERFLREARIAARLSSQHVVRVEDYGVAQDGRPFLVMELLDGESLARRMERATYVAPSETLEILRQIAAGLDAAHAAGIVHRDLKPENVFLVRGSDGKLLVKVLDFGVAKFTDTLAAGGRATASNTLVGTPRYMSPEQARSSRELDGRSDLWALGMMAYELLVGRHPFEGEAIAELLVAILTHRIPAPTTVNPDLPPEIDGFMVRALARNRAQRFASGGAFISALAEAMRDARPMMSYGRRARVGTLRLTRGAPGAEGGTERSLTPLSSGRGRASLRTPLPDASAFSDPMGSDLAEPASAEETGPVGVSVETLRSGAVSSDEASRRGVVWALMGAALVALVVLAASRRPAEVTPAASVQAQAPAAVLAPEPRAVTTPATTRAAADAAAAVPERVSPTAPAGAAPRQEVPSPRGLPRAPAVPEHRRREHPHTTGPGEYDPATI